MKKSPNRFRLPVQKLSWWADLRIQRRLKAEAKARLKNDEEDVRGWGSFLVPQYVMATLSAAIVAVSMFGYALAPSAFLPETNEVEMNELQGVPELAMMTAEPSFGYAEMDTDVMPMAAGSMLMRDDMESFPEGLVDTPLALYSPVYSPKHLSVDLAEMEMAEDRTLQEVLVVQLGYDGGFDYGVTFKFTNGSEEAVVLEGNHQNYDRLVTELVLKAQTALELAIETEMLEEYLVGELPAK